VNIEHPHVIKDTHTPLLRGLEFQPTKKITPNLVAGLEVGFSPNGGDD